MMSELKNIFLYEHTPEAIHAIEAGEARISSGGIIKIGGAGKGFQELARPASMSVADFQSLFEGKEHALETDEHLSQLDAQLALSAKGLKAIQETEWLNYAAAQRNYALTYEGFKQALNGISCVANQLSQFEQYVRRRDTKELAEQVQKYINYMNTDAGDLRSKKYSPTNGIIGEHLDQISALIKRLLCDVEAEEGDLFISVQMLINLLQPFSYVVRKFSAAYYYENDGELLPGNYDEWVKTISAVSESKKLKDMVEYYIRLKMEIPYRDKIIVSRTISTAPSKMLSGVRFEKRYIENHSKEEYLSISEQICQKVAAKSYYLKNGNLIIFLGDGKSADAD